jgi:hypothetical protein
LNVVKRALKNVGKFKNDSFFLDEFALKEVNNIRILVADCNFKWSLKNKWNLP